MTAIQQRLFGPTPDPQQSQWFTPDWLAERVVGWLDVRGMKIIELGAGDGAFVRPLLAAGCESVVAVERDERFARVLDEVAKNDTRLLVRHCDALTEERCGLGPNDGPIDAYIGNPPYEEDSDIAFVERGLGLAPRVIAILRLVFLAGQERHKRIWSKHTLARIAFLSARPQFDGERETSHSGAKSDFAVFDIRRGKHDPTRRYPTSTEWWT